MIENYTRLSSRMFTATVVGKDKNGRKITEGRETYKTPSGVYEIKDWARLVEKAAEADGLLPLLEQIKRHVKEYAWMKNASDINVLILAAECLTGRAYEHWEGFAIPMNTQADELVPGRDFDPETGEVFENGRPPVDQPTTTEQPKSNQHKVITMGPKAVNA